MTDPWSDIEPPSDGSRLALRRADPLHPLDLFRGRDHLGNYIFCYQGKLPSPEGLALPSFAIMELRLDQLEDELWQLLIRLTDRSQVDIFGALCRNLMDATREVPGGDASGIAIIVTRLTRWRELLRRVRDKRLSESEIIGLFGELLVLRDIFMVELSARDAVSAWRGPCSDEQDFVFNSWLTEVKTQLSTADAKLQIASEHQLDTSSGEIVVCHQTLAPAPEEDAQGRTLNGIVREIESVLSGVDAAVVETFHFRLVECGYLEREEYDATRWTLTRRRFFRVDEAFPRLTPDRLPPGVEQVRYSIKVSACEMSVVSEDAVKEWVFQG